MEPIHSVPTTSGMWDGRIPVGTPMIPSVRGSRGGLSDLILSVQMGKIQHKL